MRSYEIGHTYGSLPPGVALPSSRPPQPKFETAPAPKLETEPPINPYVVISTLRQRATEVEPRAERPPAPSYELPEDENPIFTQLEALEGNFGEYTPPSNKFDWLSGDLDERPESPPIRPYGDILASPPKRNMRCDTSTQALERLLIGLRSLDSKPRPASEIREQAPPKAVAPPREPLPAPSSPIGWRINVEMRHPEQPPVRPQPNRVAMQAAPPVRRFGQNVVRHAIQPGEMQPRPQPRTERREIAGRLGRVAAVLGALVLPVAATAVSNFMRVRGR